MSNEPLRVNQDFCHNQPVIKRLLVGTKNHAHEEEKQLTKNEKAFNHHSRQEKKIFKEQYYLHFALLLAFILKKLNQRKEKTEEQHMY